jgi:glyoxylase-like metal-dependent hydrolase (beta-lactamase superfamily II)
MMNIDKILFSTFPVGPLQCNCCIIGDPITKKGIVVDPGGDADLILSEVQRLGLTITDIIHTHAHLDHILAAGEIKKATGAIISVHKQDKFLWDDVERQCQRFRVPYTPQPDPDHWLQDDEELSCCAGVTMHTPGHTPGSICFLFEQYSLLVAGDTLFKHSIGRTDFEYGDFSAIENSIKSRIFTLDEETLVITGHGPSTTIGEELRENPFIRM